MHGTLMSMMSKTYRKYKNFMNEYFSKHFNNFFSVYTEILNNYVPRKKNTSGVPKHLSQRKYEVNKQ